MPGQGSNQQGFISFGVAIVLACLVAEVLHLTKVSARPVDHDKHEASDDNFSSALMYLMKYGYMDMHHHSDGKSAPLMSRDGIKKHILEFQKFAGIDQTGELDNETMKWIHMPRCGVKDIIGNDHKEVRRKKRYVLQGSRWRVKNISYRISKYPTKKRLSKEEVDRDIKKALEVWSEFTGLNFEERSSGQVHIDIRFEVGEHGDGDPFDGSGGTLAHAFFPVYGGDAHFDDEEMWTTDSYTGTNLLQTAAHEFGHSLGLSHSDNNEALMAPFYRGFETKPRLHNDDIRAIQALYGEKDSKENFLLTTSAIPTTVSPSRKIISAEEVPNSIDPNGSNLLCRNGSVDTIFSLNNGETYVFKGFQYWKLNEESVAPGYPRLISNDWDGLPGQLDAGFTWTNNKTYFFRGTEYWRFTNKKMDRGYPKSIRSGFDGIPSFIDAAFVWSGNGKIYFFKGDKYYKFDPEKKPPVSDDFPKPVSNWEGIPNNIDDALQYTNGITYFFKGGKYWRFNDRNFKVDEGSPDFPRPTGPWWFGCKNQLKD